MAVLLLATHMLLGDPSTALEAECTARRRSGADPADVADVCRRAFEAVPGGPGDRRTQLLATAHDLYQKALRAHPDPDLACADAAMLRTYAAQLAKLPDGQRPGDREDVKKALGEIDPGLMVHCTSPETSPPPPDPSPTQPTISPRRPEPVPLTPIVNPPRADNRRRRGLRLAGGALLGVGLGSSLVMLGALVRGAALRSRAESTHAMYPGETTIPMDVEIQYDEDRARGWRANQLAIGFAASAAVLVGAGAALLIVDKRGKAHRAMVSPFALSTPGVRISLEF